MEALKLVVLTAVTSYFISVESVRLKRHLKAKNEDARKKADGPIVRAFVANQNVLQNYQQVEGWCYANAATTMQRYYLPIGSDAVLTQCEVATRNCRTVYHDFVSDCCASPATTFRGSRVNPNSDTRQVPSFFDYIQFDDNSCCMKFGDPSPFIQDSIHTYNETRFGLQLYRSSDEEQPSEEDLVTAIGNNQPFLLGDALHYYVCYGYEGVPDDESFRLITHDARALNSTKTPNQPLTKFTYQEYRDMQIKLHFSAAPEVRFRLSRYADENEQLKNMGFSDPYSNFEALQRGNGNVSRAINVILGG